MKPSPEQFSFTNHFNRSLLKSRIEMMNRETSWKSRWRYGIMLSFGFLSFISLATFEPTRPNGADTGSKYMLWHNRQLYGVITNNTTDEDLLRMKSEIKRFGIHFEIQGVKRSIDGKILDINRVVFGNFGQYALWEMKQKLNNATSKLPLLEFHCKQSEGCRMDIPWKEYPSSLTSIMNQEGIVSIASLFQLFKHSNQTKNTAKLTTSNGDWTIIKHFEGGKLTKTERVQTLQPGESWMGNRQQLGNAIKSHSKRPLVMITEGRFLRLSSNFQLITDIFIDGQKATLTQLQQIELGQVQTLTAHRRGGLIREPFVQDSYALWIETTKP